MTARRIGRIALWTLAVLVALPIVLVLLILAVANVGPGQRFIAGEIGQATGGMVRVQNIGGRFPDALSVGQIDIQDAKGIWLSLTDVHLDWSPLALVGGHASIQRLSAERLSLPRLPVSSAAIEPAPVKNGSGFSLPVSVRLDRLAVARADLGAAVAGHAAVLRIGGDADVATLDDGRINLAIDRLDGPGTYRLTGQLDARTIAAHLTAAEPAGGFVGGVAGLPDLGALSLEASIDGPRSAEKTQVALAAGQLRLGVQGLVDLTGQKFTLSVTGSAPAMAPRPDIAWQSIALQADVKGPFNKPDVSAHATVAALSTGGAHVGTLTADATGNQGAIDVHLVMGGMVLPPPKPDLFARGTLDLVAHVDLDQPTRPIKFQLTQALLSADGTAQTAGDLAARLHVVVPDITPLAALGGVNLQGRTEAVATLASHGDERDITVDGTTGFTGGQAPVPTLLGATSFGVTAKLTGQDLRVSRADVKGRALTASVTGSDLGGALDLAWHVAISDLSAAAPSVIGAIEASGRVQGPQTSMALDADLTGNVGTKQIAKGPMQLAVHAGGLPGTPAGTVVAQGKFDGSPVTIQADLQQSADGGLHALLRHAAWKSLTADADVALAKGAHVPGGRVSLRMTRLADLAPLLAQPISGAFSATVVSATAGGRPDAKIDVLASNVSVGANSLQRLSVSGHVADPASTPDVSLTLAATGIAAGAITGDAHATAHGPQSALDVRADAQLHGVAGDDAHFAARLLADLTRKQILLSALSADAKGEQLRLAAPARVSFADGVSVDRLRLALGQATLDVAGKISPSLSLTAALRGVTPDLAKPFAPSLSAAGVLTADARLTGTTAAPQGSVRVSVQGLRMRSGPAAPLPAASALVTVALAGQQAQVDARAQAGPKLNVDIAGSAPLGVGPLALRALGKIDLTLLNPILGATGQRAEGLLALNGTIGGTTAAPALGGTLTLSGGEVQDYVQGVRIHDIGALIEASGESVRIARFAGQAGDGTISASGSVGIAAPGMPINLHIAADHARPLASDRLTATLDASIDITGQASENMLVAGRVFLRRVTINIPDSFPPTVAKLDVRRPGDKPPPPSNTPAAVVRLDLTVDAPNNIFVRGHGLDSELGGKLTVAGTANAPQISGGFEMRRGDISVAGTTLQFSKGEVSFDGTGVNGAIDPTLNFEADTTSAGVTATLAVTGYADAPKIKLSSSPDLPQDEVLAHLLFGTSIRNLSAVQIAEIAAAVAELSGVGGGGPGVLGNVRSSLGLDRLDVSGGSGGTGTTVEAGRYVARGVYVGAKQATSGGGGTLAQVQIDLTRRLKATAQVGTGGGSVQGATPDNDSGSTLGLSYRFEY